MNIPIFQIRDCLSGSLLLTFLLILVVTTTTISAQSEPNETCLDCHDGMELTLSMTPHSSNKSSSSVNCVDCHNNYKEHIEDPSIENINRLQNISQQQANKICASCHQPHSELDNFGFDAHQVSEVNCNSCHQVHSNKISLLVDGRADFCTKCHTDIKANFMRRSNHPINQQALTCLSCHNFSKSVDNNLSYDLEKTCQSCHPQQAGPFMYEHDASLAYSVEGGGCIECHEPHGSENNHLLKQPVNDLCNSCHIVPTHLIAHPNRNYDQANCNQCHTGTHGSFTSNIFLDENLPDKFNQNCYNSGCHSLNK